MTRRLALVALVAVVLAGCSVFSPSPDASAPAETVTPAPVPTDAGTDEPNMSLPPGVAADGSLSPADLAAAHYDALGGRSFAWTQEYERGAPAAESAATTVSRRLLVGSDGSFRFDRRLSADRRGAVYADESGTYVRSRIENASERRYHERRFDYRRYLPTQQTLTRYLPTEGASVSRVDRRGREYLRIHATSPPATVRNGHAKQTVHNYTATAYVTPEGVVRSVVVRYEYTLRDDRIAVSIRENYEAIDGTTVERPDWVTETNGTAGPGGSPTPVGTTAGTPAADSTAESETETETETEAETEGETTGSPASATAGAGAEER